MSVIGNVAGNAISKVQPLSSNTVTSPTNVGKYEGVSNPYAELPRQRTFWDKLANFFGARSGYDKAQEQYNLAGAEYNAQMQQIAAEDAYNSAGAQADRMRAAGLNPDLLGVSGEAGASFDNQQTPPDVSAGADFGSTVSQLGSLFMSAVSGTMALFKDFNSLKQMKIANDSADLDVASKMMNFLNLSNPLFKQYYSGEDNVPGFRYSEFIHSFFRSERNAKRFKKLREVAEDSLLGLTNQYKDFADFYKSAEDTASVMSKPYMQSFFPGVSIDTLARSMKPLSDAIYDMNMAQYEAIKKAQKYESNKTDYNQQVLNGLDPNLDSEAINTGHSADIAENSARREIAPLKIDTARVYKKMIQGLKQLSDDGDLFAGILGTLLGSKFLGADTFGPASQIFNVGKGLVGTVSDLRK